MGNKSHLVGNVNIKLLTQKLTSYYTQTDKKYKKKYKKTKNVLKCYRVHIDPQTKTLTEHIFFDDGTRIIE